MQPLKPEQKNAVLNDNPSADPADLQEYERLLSERFTMDPDEPAAAADTSTADAPARDAQPNTEQRLRQLHEKLFRHKR